MGDFSNDDHNATFFHMPTEYDITNADFNMNDPTAIYLNTEMNVPGGTESSANDPALKFLEEFGGSQDFSSIANFPTSPIESFSASSGPYGPRIQQQSTFVNSPTTTTGPVTTGPTASNPSATSSTSSKRNITIEDKTDGETSNEKVKEDLSVSAEEDKRRRNTAASARFRVKKKQREQAMEKLAKDMTEKVSVLDARVKELEKENRLLKGLLTEKAGRGDGSSDEQSGKTIRSRPVKTDEGR